MLEVHVQPSPEPPVERLHRLCRLVMGEHGYGFNMHSDKTRRGQFVNAAWLSCRQCGRQALSQTGAQRPLSQVI